MREDESPKLKEILRLLRKAADDSDPKVAGPAREALDMLERPDGPGEQSTIAIGTYE